MATILRDRSDHFEVARDMNRAADRGRAKPQPPDIWFRAFHFGENRDDRPAISGVYLCESEAGARKMAAYLRAEDEVNAHVYNRTLRVEGFGVDVWVVVGRHKKVRK